MKTRHGNTNSILVLTAVGAAHSTIPPGSVSSPTIDSVLHRHRRTARPPPANHGQVGYLCLLAEEVFSGIGRRARQEVLQWLTWCRCNQNARPTKRGSALKRSKRGQNRRATMPTVSTEITVRLSYGEAPLESGVVDGMQPVVARH